MKIINLNKVTINGDDSYDYSSESDSWDHGYGDHGKYDDSYNGWIETTNRHNRYNRSL